MHKKVFIYIVFLIIFIFSSKVFSQEFIAKNFKELPTDISARSNQVLDVNDEPCALVKIYTALNNLKISGNMGVEKVEIKDGVVWVYVPRGTRQLKISKDGMPMLPFTLPKGLEKSTVYSFTLITNQSLAISINTPGVDANVEINGLTFKTNRPIPDLEEGEYSIKITCLGYLSIYDTITIDIENNDYTYNLDRTKKAKLTISSLPNECEIFINDEYIGNTDFTGMFFADIFRITLKKKNYLIIDTVIEFNPKIQSDFNFVLNKNIAYAEFEVTPPEAFVYINGELVSEKKIELEAGVNHELIIKDEQYRTYIETFTIERNATTKKVITLAKQSGKVSLAIEPANAKVILVHEDGSTYKWKGNKTQELPIGSYKLNISNKGYNTRKTSLIISDNRTVNYERDLGVKSVVRARTGFYSALVPGLGQFHSQRNIAGAAFMTSTLGLASAAIYFNSQAKKLGDTYTQAQDAYKNETDAINIEASRAQVDNAWSDYEKAYKQRDQFVNAALTVYLINIIDAIIFSKYHSPDKKRNIDIGCFSNPYGSGVTLTYKFSQ